MIDDHYIFFCGVFASLFVGAFFVLSGLEMRKIGNEAAERQRKSDPRGELSERN